jgi:hypothetical protein
MFPRARPVFPDNALLIEMNSSGEDVPKATTVSPITMGDNLNRNARDEAPSTNQFADLISIISPMTRNKIAKNIDYIYIIIYFVFA